MDKESAELAATCINAMAGVKNPISFIEQVGNLIMGAALTLKTHDLTCTGYRCSISTDPLREAFEKLRLDRKEAVPI